MNHETTDDEMAENIKDVAALQEERNAESRVIIGELVSAGLIEADYADNKNALDNEYEALSFISPQNWLENEVQRLRGDCRNDEPMPYNEKLRMAYNYIVRAQDRTKVHPLLLTLDYIYPPEEPDQEVANLTLPDVEERLLLHDPEYVYHEMEEALTTNPAVRAALRTRVNALLVEYNIVDEDAFTVRSPLIYLAMHMSLFKRLDANNSRRDPDDPSVTFAHTQQLVIDRLVRYVRNTAVSDEAAMTGIQRALWLEADAIIYKALGPDSDE